MDNKLLVRRLSHFVPSTYSLGGNKKSFDEIVSLAIYFLNKSTTISEIEKSLSDMLGIRIPEEEIQKTLEILITAGKLNRIGSQFDLTYDERKKIKTAIEVEKQTEESVLNDWSKKLKATYPDISDKEILCMREDLKYFLKNLFVIHGIESISLITKEFGDFDLDLSIHTICDHLPKREGLLGKIRFIEFKQFLNVESPFKQEYLISLLDKSLRYLMAICHEDIISSLKKRLENKIVYLDTSVVFRLLNLQGTRRKKVIDEVVDICNEYGIKLHLSKASLIELKRRIAFDSRVLADNPIPRNLTRLGYKYTTEENFITTYWYIASTTGLTVRDYIDIYKHVEDLLRSSGIIVEDDFPESLTNDKIVAEANLYESKLRSFAALNSKERSDVAIQHDCYMLSYVNTKRACTSGNLVDCGCWFLTADHLLLKFQSTLYDLKLTPAIAILPSHLIQLLRFAKVENGQYDETFINVFATNSTFVSYTVPTELIMEILARIGFHTDSPTFAEKVLMDTVLVHKLSEIATKEEREELIDEALECIYKELESENAMLITRIEQQEKAIETEKQKNIHQQETTDLVLHRLNAVDELIKSKEAMIDSLKISSMDFDEAKKAVDKKIKEKTKIFLLLCLSITILSLVIFCYLVFFKKQFNVIEPILGLEVFFVGISYFIDKIFPQNNLSIINIYINIITPRIKRRLNYDESAHKQLITRLDDLMNDVHWFKQQNS